jgi:hypothetical protein
VPDEITAGQAARLLDQISPSGPVARARCEIAAGLPAGIRYPDARRREARTKLAAAVKASGTSLTEVFGAGPVVAATVIGDVVTVARFPTRDHFAAYNGTAPAGVSCGEKKTCRLPCAATGGTATRSRWPRSPRSGTSTATAAPAASGRSPRGRPAKRRCAA